LYCQVFDVARDAWGQGQEVARHMTEHMGMPDIPPDSLVVYQHAGGNFKRARCTGSIVREWVFDGSAFEEHPVPPGPSGRGYAYIPRPVPRTLPPGSPNEHSSFFVQGVVRFCIRPDRRQVIVTYVLGPRYGAGQVYSVIGDGASGTLEPIALSGWRA